MDLPRALLEWLRLSFSRLMSPPPIQNRVGILIVGSLIWDQDATRVKWRASRLDTQHQILVPVPIRYGRLAGSRNNTYTMTFGGDAAIGRGLVVACRQNGLDDAALMREAEALWMAETKGGATEAPIAAKWGCVGAVFFCPIEQAALIAGWEKGFRAGKNTPIDPINADGVLETAWPGKNTLTGLGISVLLATATKPTGAPPTPGQIADAWIANGCEEYFFHNVEYGIRTADDGAIWDRMVAKKAPFIADPNYVAAIRILSAEAAARRS